MQNRAQPWVALEADNLSASNEYGFVRIYTIYAHCTDIRKLRSIIRKSCVRSRSNPPAPCALHRASAASLGKETTRDLSRVVSVQQLQYVRWVGVSGDGMQEPPNESDASVSTRIIVFGSYALLLHYLYCLFLEIPF